MSWCFDLIYGGGHHITYLKLFYCSFFAFIHYELWLIMSDLLFAATFLAKLCALLISVYRIPALFSCVRLFPLSELRCIAGSTDSSEGASWRVAQAVAFQFTQVQKDFDQASGWCIALLILLLVSPFYVLIGPDSELAYSRVFWCLILVFLFAFARVESYNSVLTVKHLKSFKYFQHSDCSVENGERLIREFAAKLIFVDGTLCDLAAILVFQPFHFPFVLFKLIFRKPLRDLELRSQLGLELASCAANIPWMLGGWLFLLICSPSKWLSAVRAQLSYSLLPPIYIQESDSFSSQEKFQQLQMALQQRWAVFYIMIANRNQSALFAWRQIKSGLSCCQSVSHLVNVLSQSTARRLRGLFYGVLLIKSVFNLCSRSFGGFQITLNSVIHKANIMLKDAILFTLVRFRQLVTVVELVLLFLVVCVPLSFTWRGGFSIIANFLRSENVHQVFFFCYYYYYYYCYYYNY